MHLPYNINPFFTNTTSDELDFYLKSVVDELEVTPQQTQQAITFDVNATFNLLKEAFSKMYYEILPNESREKILEYCLTLYSGKVRNVFSNFVPLNMPIENRVAAIRYLTYHLIIYLCEMRKETPLKLLDEVIKVFDIPTYQELAKGYIQPLNSFSDLSNIAHLRVKIDECLIRIKHTGLTETNLTTLLVFLIILELCDPFL